MKEIQGKTIANAEVTNDAEGYHVELYFTDGSYAGISLMFPDRLKLNVSGCFSPNPDADMIRLDTKVKRK